MPEVCYWSQHRRNFWCHQDWLALASEVLKHAMMSGMMAVRGRVRVVVVGEDRVGVRSLWVTLCHVIGLLSKARQRRQLSQLQWRDTVMLCVQATWKLSFSQLWLFIQWGIQITNETLGFCLLNTLCKPVLHCIDSGLREKMTVSAVYILYIEFILRAEFPVSLNESFVNCYWIFLRTEVFCTYSKLIWCLHLYREITGWVMK